MDSVNRAMHLLDEVQVALAVLDSSGNKIPVSVFDNLAKATSVLEIIYYDRESTENGYAQPECNFQ